MSRYIAADVAIDKIDCLFRDTERDKGNFMLTGYNHAVADCIAILKNLDTLEVVRCKDCRYWEELTPASDNAHYGKCGDADCYSPEWWFCADGERREVTE